MEKGAGGGRGGGVPSVAVVMAVRNESSYIASVLNSLDCQDLPPSLVVVVDDGSTDGTRGVVESLRGSLRIRVEVIPLAHHEASHMGRPQLARVMNAGLSFVRGFAPPVDYVMKLDGDHPLPRDYISRIIERMEGDPRLGVASGRIDGEPFTPGSPRGSGMIARREFWERADGLRFPVEYGWESWLYLRAQADGYETRSFPDIVSRTSRPTSFSQGFDHGRGMYALGYFWPFALGRCLVMLPRSPAAALQMFRGYLDHRGVGVLDVGGWVGATQRRNLLRRGASRIRGTGAF